MEDKKILINKNLAKLHIELENVMTLAQDTKEELENFLSQFTCVLDAPSCGCSEEELNDPKFDALYTEQDRLSKLSKSYSTQIKELKAQIDLLEKELNNL